MADDDKFRADLAKAIKTINDVVDNCAEAINVVQRREIARLAMYEMQDLISKGISPIKEVGRFPGYLDTKKYPGGPNSSARKINASKRSRPVNLYLRGDFLQSMRAWVDSQKNPVVGFKDELSKKKEEGHRAGSSKNHPEITKRPVIPEDGEHFAQRVEKVIADQVKNIVEKYLRDALK